MEPIEHLFRQLELEGIQRVGTDLIARASAEVGDLPLIILARTCDGQTLICFDGSVPSRLRDLLSETNLQPLQADSVMMIFENAGIRAKVSHFKTYIFPAKPEPAGTEPVKWFSRDDPKVVAFGFGGLGDSVFGIEQDGTILSACVSSRQNSKCAEAWVFTHPDCRRKGLARQVVTAWAGSMHNQGITPFYSHDVENASSAILAQRLNLIHVFDETVIEPAS